ncbi:MAG: Zn-ribbon domain-containing OB-fold protein [Candidatus Hadarchaeales archaeon]
MAVPRFWREIPSRYNLIGSRCENCNKVFFPPRYICPQCRRVGKMQPHSLNPYGKVVSHTTIYAAASGFEDQVPYALAIIELDEGPKVLTQVTDCDPNDLRIGDRVELIFRKLGEEGEDGVIYYGYKARKVNSKPASQT